MGRQARWQKQMRERRPRARGQRPDVDGATTSLEASLSTERARELLSFVRSARYMALLTCLRTGHIWTPFDVCARCGARKVEKGDQS